MTTEMVFPALKGKQFLSLTTFRKSGQAVPTPVWFAEDTGRLVVFTSSTSGKVKRIRNNTAVTVASCTYNGKVTSPAVNARAIILPPEKHADAERLLSKKYGWQKRLFQLMARLRRAKENQVIYLEITPV